MTLRQMYTTLGLSEGANISEVKRAYRDLAKRLHPDVSGWDGTREEFERVSVAYCELLERLSRDIVRNRSMNLADIGRQLEFGSSETIRLGAARMLGRCGRKAAYPYLRKALYDESEDVVIAVVRAIGALRIAQASGELAALFLRTSLRVKEEIIEVAETMGDKPQFLSLALTGMSDGNRTIRRRCVRLYSRQKRAV